MLNFIDRDAFLSALDAASQPRLTGVDMPGVGSCYKRQLTAGDVFDADTAREALKANGIVADRKVNVAIGLAQTLCDEAGHPLLDPQDPAHIRKLIALPWEALRGVLMPGDEEAAAAAQADPNAR